MTDTPAGPAPKAHRCPRCKEPLGPGSVDGLAPKLTAFSCPACRGHFLSPAAFKDVEATTFPKLVELRRLPDNAEQLQLLGCPACDGHPLMEKFRHPKDRHVVVDRCRECSAIWLDAGEAAAIREESLPVFVARTARYFYDLLS